MAWQRALAGPLAGATCLWQDLDGLHVEPAPASAPPTSALWAWAGSRLIRVRLDGDTAFVAVHDEKSDGQQTRVRTLPWPSDDARIAASRGRGPAPGDGGVGGAYEQVVVDGIGDGAGPVTFIRPSRLAAGI